MPSGAPIRAAIAAMLGFVFAAGGCGASRDGAPGIEAGTPCARCGMETRDLRWAAARRVDGRVRVYDSIECALSEGGAPKASRGSTLYLADFTTAALHRSDSLWVVRADIPSPMGGGLAAFLDRGAAERVAAERNGRTGRLDAFSSSGGEGGGETAKDARALGVRP